MPNNWTPETEPRPVAVGGWFRLKISGIERFPNRLSPKGERPEVGTTLTVYPVESVEGKAVAVPTSD